MEKQQHRQANAHDFERSSTIHVFNIDEGTPCTLNAQSLTMGSRTANSIDLFPFAYLCDVLKAAKLGTFVQCDNLVSNIEVFMGRKLFDAGSVSFFVFGTKGRHLVVPDCILVCLIKVRGLNIRSAGAICRLGCFSSKVAAVWQSTKRNNTRNYRTTSLFKFEQCCTPSTSARYADQFAGSKRIRGMNLLR
eukprot:357400-Amphidinium_carterae.1